MGDQAQNGDSTEEREYSVHDSRGHRGSRWLRVALILLIVMALAVGGVTVGSYLWFRSQVSGANSRVSADVKEALRTKPSTTLVAASDSPSAMNIIVLGSDKRAQSGEAYGRSDTMIILHVDPGNDYLSMLSLPRDSWVTIPGHGQDRLNAAYAIGGPALMIKTVKQLTGVDINKYMEVDFQAFKDLTDVLGGVYVDVDRAYYQPNPHYELINSAPGYQRLDGTDALKYVRFRHDLNADFGRMQRQQRFISAVREQAMGWSLPLKLPGLISALFKNVNTNLSADDFIKLAYWAVKLDGSRIRQITVDGANMRIRNMDVLSISGTTWVNALRQLLTPSPKSSTTTTTKLKVDLTGMSLDIRNENGKSAETKSAAMWLTSLGATIVTSTDVAATAPSRTRVEYPSGQQATADLIADLVGANSVVLNPSAARVTVVMGSDFVLPPQYKTPVGVDAIPDAAMWRARSAAISFPVQAPSWLPPGYSLQMPYPQTGGTYNIKVGSGTKPGLKIVYVLKKRSGTTNECLGIMETTWLDAPAASKGVYAVDFNGVTYTLVGSIGKVDHVWWKKDGVLYWVSNTIMYDLTADQLLGVAESMVVVPKS